MPYSRESIPGRNVERGTPLDTVFGSDLLKPTSFIAPTPNTGITSARMHEPFIIRYVLTEDTACANVVAPIPPVKFEILDYWIVNQGATTNGTITLKTNINGAGATDLGAALTAAVDHTIGRATTIDNAQAIIDPDNDTADAIAILSAGDSSTRPGAHINLLCARIV